MMQQADHGGMSMPHHAHWKEAVVIRAGVLLWHRLLREIKRGACLQHR